MSIIEVLKEQLINYNGYIIVLLAFNVLDLLSAIPNIVEQGYKSSLMSKGLINKLSLYIVLCVSLGIDYVVNGNGNVFKTVCIFFVANEGLSILENLQGHVPLPNMLVKLLNGLKDDNEFTDPTDKDQGIG